MKLPEMMCDFFEITDKHGAEHLTRLPIALGDVVVADRAYSRSPGVAAILRAGGEVIVRLLPSSFPLQKRNTQAFDLLSTLEKNLQHEGQVLERPVQFEHEGGRFELRLCAIRKSEAATAAARRLARAERARKGGTVKEETLRLAAFVYVLTSLPQEIISKYWVLNLYRCRWQVELASKRLKSLLALGHLPKKDPVSCRAWMQAKILISLLIEKLIIESELFSPGSDGWEDVSRWNCFIEARDTLLAVLSMPLSIPQLKARGRAIGTSFQRPRKDRARQVHQITDIDSKC